MRVIDMNRKDAMNRVTVLSYGAMRTGKTRWAASFPRPLFLSDTTESGWTTIQNMDRQALWEPERVPQVWAIERAADMMQALGDVDSIVRNKPGEILTLVIDSLTFYADLFFSAIDAAARQGGKMPDNRLLFMHLASHLRELRIRVHQLPLNVVWLALEKAPDPDYPVGGPMLSGQNAQKFAAGCDYILYHRSFQLNAQSPLQWEVRTKRFHQYQAGGRDEGLLPDPLGYVGVDTNNNEVFVPDCTYRTFAEALGLGLPAQVQANGKSTQAAPVAKTPTPSGTSRASR